MIGLTVGPEKRKSRPTIVRGFVIASHAQVSAGGSKEDTSDDGFSYGAGAGVTFSEVNSLNIEWKVLAKIDGGEAEGLSLNFQRKF